MSTSPSCAHHWVLPIIPKLHNRMRGAHWTAVKGERDRWGKAVLAIHKGPWWAPLQDPPLFHARKVRLRILVYRKGLQDPDNAVASCKYLVDALRARGWMVNDTREWLDSVVEEKIDRKNTRTEITWEVLGEP